MEGLSRASRLKKILSNSTATYARAPVPRNTPSNSDSSIQINPYHAPVINLRVPFNFLQHPTRRLTVVCKLDALFYELAFAVLQFFIL